MDIIKLTRELGAAIQQDERYLNLKKAKEAADADAALQQLIGDFNLKRMAINNEAMKQDRSEEKLQALNTELRETYAQIMQNENMTAYNQAREALDLACDDEILKLEIMEEIFGYLSNNFTDGTNSNKTGSVMHKIIKEKTGCLDPYFKEKIQGNEIALKYLPEVKRIIDEDDSLENYVKIAIIGNILDFGAFTLDDDIESVIKEALKKDLAIKDIDEFENSLIIHDKALYLVDNTGEIVFDKLLMSKIKEYGLDITIAVKSEPILNDACMSEALDAGLDEFGEIVEIGCGTVGYVDSEISQEFREIFNAHKFIISKGMGNYEGLTEIDLSDKDIYFLLCAKCNTISRDIGVNLHDMLLFKK